ncbi:MAG TPA: hypothetical protein VLZ83_03370 [Edaphocola sp.]|nr:hypothetical protein [Edaphocola sp.]
MKVIYVLLATLLFSITVNAQYKTPQQQRPPQQSINFQKVGAPMPNFIVNKTTGGVFSSQSLVKGKPVMIMIFSPDCDHCGYILDSLKTIKNLFKQTQFVLVAEERNKDKMAAFIKSHKLIQDGIYKAIGTNRGDLIAALYTYKVLPQIIFYDGNHRLIKILDGNTYTLNDIRKYIK